MLRHARIADSYLSPKVRDFSETDTLSVASIEGCAPSVQEAANNIAALFQTFFEKTKKLKKAETDSAAEHIARLLNNFVTTTRNQERLRLSFVVHDIEKETRNALSAVQHVFAKTNGDLQRVRAKFARQKLSTIAWRTRCERARANHQKVIEKMNKAFEKISCESNNDKTSKSDGSPTSNTSDFAYLRYLIWLQSSTTEQERQKNSLLLKENQDLKRALRLLTKNNFQRLSDHKGISSKIKGLIGNSICEETEHSNNEQTIKDNHPCEETNQTAKTPHMITEAPILASALLMENYECIKCKVPVLFKAHYRFSCAHSYCDECLQSDQNLSKDRCFPSYNSQCARCSQEEHFTLPAESMAELMNAPSTLSFSIAEEIYKKFSKELQDETNKTNERKFKKWLLLQRKRKTLSLYKNISLRRRTAFTYKRRSSILSNGEETTDEKNQKTNISNLDHNILLHLRKSNKIGNNWEKNLRRSELSQMSVNSRLKAPQKHGS